MTTSTDAAVIREGLTSLSWDQLANAIVASQDEYEARFYAFTAAAEMASEAALLGLPSLAEARAAQDGCWAACKAQSAMTAALTDERAKRRDRGDYA